MVDLSDKVDLRRALEYVQSRVGVVVPAPVSDLYFAGRMREAGTYEKLGPDPLSGHPFWAYILAAEGYLRQPSLESFYDIFRAARAIPLLRRLETVLHRFEDADIERHRQKIQSCATYDELDATLFELIVAGTYRERFANADVALLRETQKEKSPDILVEFAAHRRLYVECKSFNRVNAFQAALRSRISELLCPLLPVLRAGRSEVAVRVVFGCHPDDVTPAEVVESLARSRRAGGVATSPKLAVEVGPLGKSDRDFLYPSPKYFSQRFGYDSSQWHGIIPALEGKRSGISFFEGAAWDAAILWRVDHPETLWRINKLNYQLLFKGFRQLGTRDARLNLHAWFERSSAWGHRAEHLHRFFSELNQSSEPFANIVFNETHPDVTPGGHFDFREHASAIGGPLRLQERPEVMNVFGGLEDFQGVGEWGIGASLSSLDTES